MAGSSIAGMLVGTVFIVIFASATVTMVDNINNAQLASQVDLPSPEITLISSVWDDTSNELTYTITNTGSDTVQREHIFLSVDSATPFQSSSWTPAFEYIFPGETFVLVDTTFVTQPTRVFLVVFEYSSSVAVTT